MAKLLSGDDIYTSMNWPSAWSNDKQLITGSKLYSAENYYSVPIGAEITTSFNNYGIDNDDKIISTCPKINCAVNQSRCVAIANAANMSGVTCMAQIVLMSGTAATLNSGQIYGLPIRATSWVTRQDVETTRGGAYVFDITSMTNTIQSYSANSNFNLYVRFLPCDYDGNITSQTPVLLQNYGALYSDPSFTYVKYTELVLGLPYIHNISIQYQVKTN